MSCKEHTIVDDQHTGDFVCIVCGIVQDISYQYTDDFEPMEVLKPTEFSVIVERLNLPRFIAKDAEELYKQLKDEKKLKRYKGNQAACIFIICEQNGIHRTFKEMSVATDIDKYEIGKIVKSIRQVLAMKQIVPQTETYMTRYCAKLKQTYEFEKRAIAFVDCAKELSNKTHIIISAVAIYIVSNKTISLSDICSVIGVSEYSVKETFNELYPYVISGVIKV